MASPLDSDEVAALMQAIQEGRVAQGDSDEANRPVIPYDLTSQDRIIRGQMPTLDSINDRLATQLGKSLAARTRLEVRATTTPATLLKFSDVGPLLEAPGTVAVLNLGAGHGLALLILEGQLAQALLSSAFGDRKVRSANATPEAHPELTVVERLVLKHLIAMVTDAMRAAWAEVIPFKPEVLRFEADMRLLTIANPSDVTILCSFELAGAIEGRIQLVLPYAAVESAKKLLSSSPRLGGQSDARFSSALARELEAVEVELRVEIGKRTLTLSDLLKLQVGEVLTLPSNETTPLPVFVQGRLKMSGSPRVVSGSTAVEILRALRAAPASRQRTAAGQSDHSNS
jgi:flagellar motor switch protein FliM